MKTAISRREFVATTLASAAGIGYAGAAMGGRMPAVNPVIPESQIGVWELPTPALVVDIEAMEANLRKMQAFMAGKPAALRPCCCR